MTIKVGYIFIEEWKEELRDQERSDRGPTQLGL